MTYQEYLSQDYKDLVSAAKKITGNAPHALELLHYAIVDFSYKPNMQEVIDAGAARFYLIRIMMTQHRSITGPFYRNYIKQRFLPLFDEVPAHEEEVVDVDRVKHLLSKLPWYDRELFRLYSEGQHNYTTLSQLTRIPRTSISLTIRRVRDYVKSNL